MGLKEYNRIQIKLIHESNIGINEWIDRYAKQFSEIVDKGEAGIEDIRKRLY